MEFQELRVKNQLMAKMSNYKAVDAYSGGCGMTMRAINAGLNVVAGYEVAKEGVEISEKATNKAEKPRQHR